MSVNATTGWPTESRQYLAARKIEWDKVQHLNIKLHPNRLELAWPNIGASKFLNLGGDQKYSWDKPKEIPTPLIWNDDVLYDEKLKETTIIITEGEIDALSLICAGFERVVTLTSGAGLKKAHDALEQHAEAFAGAPLVILAFDNDGPGEEAAKGAVKFLRAVDVEVASVKWPYACKDANETLVKHDLSILKGCIDTANAYIDHAGLVIGAGEERPYKKKDVFKSGLTCLDGISGFMTGQLSCIVGYPNMGKTTFLIWLLSRLSSHNKVNCGLIAFENEWYEIKENIELIYGCGGYAQGQKDPALVNAMNRIKLVDVEKLSSRGVEFDFNWIQSIFAQLAFGSQTRIIAIDPFNCLSHQKYSANDIEYYNAMLTDMKRLASAYDMHVILCVHPTKPPAGQDLKSPTGTSISGSMAFNNKCGLGLAVHRNKDEPGITQITSWKVRAQRMVKAEPDVIKMSYDERRNTFSGVRTPSF